MHKLDPSGAGPQSCTEETVVAPSNANVEERFRLLVESVRDYAIIMLDPEGYIVTWNEGAEHINGYKANEILGQHISRFYPPEEIKNRHPQAELEAAKANGRYEEEGWRVRKDGNLFWANIVITRLTDKSGRLVGYAKVTRDLTERKRAEEALRLSEEHSRAIWEKVRDYAMFTLDAGGYIQTWNEGARRIKGYEANEIIGKHLSTFYPEEDIQMGKCEYELKEATETGRYEEEGWRIRKDGTRFWANVVITAIRNKSGKLTGFTKVTRDVTERKRAEDKLRMANEMLEKRVAERTAQLSQANNALQEAVRARDEFLSIASHELRTPLTPLKLQLQGLLLQAERGTLLSLPAERIKRMTRAADQAVTRLGFLIDNLLDVSRINAGKIALNPEPLDLSELTREVVDRHAAEVANARCSITVDAPTPVNGSFDRLRIEQIVTNLLTNALKYGSGKSISLKVSYLSPATVCIQVTDQGIGISSEDQVRIFNRFERVASNSNIGGLGLGLYITRQIIEAHGGKIRVESERGKGATFSVELPLNTPSKEGRA
jgi:PAS domain S-box-containing protein